MDPLECREATYSSISFLQNHLQRTPPLLYSFPGSGNTWVRLLLDFSTGVYSGSVYSDSALFDVLPGEAVCNKRVSVIKAHPHIQTYKILNAGNLLPGKCTEGGVQRFDRAIFLLRDPFYAIWSEFQRRRSGSHVGGIPRTRFSDEKWRSHRGFLSLKYKEMMANEYAGLLKSLAPADVFVVKYEDLKNPITRESTLEGLVRFVDVNSSFPSSRAGDIRKRIHCAFSSAEKAGIRRRPAHGNDVVTINEAYTREAVCEMWTQFGPAAATYNYSIFGGIQC